MRFAQQLIAGRLVRHYKRFLAEVELAEGEIITVHCPNSGSMLGCREPGSPVLLSVAANPKRKYPHTWELVQSDGYWVGINTARTNALVREALEKGVIAELQPIEEIRAEVKVSARSRLDFCLTHPALAASAGQREKRHTYLEVKNCTLVEQGRAMFPDAVTSRGTRHLEELLRLCREGHAAAVLFCVQHGGAQFFTPAAHIDPAYAETLARVAAGGVEILAYRATPTPAGITLDTPLPVHL
ncbi:DNA/RNA nuclease SfsA [Desulfurivibrio alkaliphilus]|uniref:Sugar fermentation stimulation protein homolog n=1 Tax=Desulfurivibrio alkaliphilus (strain DSM 19089 / UNIQEM U267 / AHT2) TaxID=589865 RepID=D6Z732_DESAT|nr:DNA/RNA nuclease SfsA [Desulfurivibrio alkaliphilus]ADH87019.1 sugar fermentation stimulation protein [Desulfurivibrio alkaliphilus AHT 2]